MDEKNAQSAPIKTAIAQLYRRVWAVRIADVGYAGRQGRAGREREVMEDLMSDSDCHDLTPTRGLTHLCDEAKEPDHQ